MYLEDIVWIYGDWVIPEVLSTKHKEILRITASSAGIHKALFIDDGWGTHNGIGNLVGYSRVGEKLAYQHEPFEQDKQVTYQEVMSVLKKIILNHNDNTTKELDNKQTYPGQ